MITRPDPSQFQMRDYKVLAGDLTQRLELSDGSVIEVRAVLQGILKTGNDPGTGLPLYAATMATIVRLVSDGPGTRAAPTPKEAPTGFA